MKNINLKTTLITSIVSLMVIAPAIANADWKSGDRANNTRQIERHIDKRPNLDNRRQEHRQDDRQLDRRIDRRQDRRFENRHGNRLGLVTPRHRNFRHIIVVRPHGHTFYGYGRYYNDNDAWKWLALTGITLKLLDMVDEQAQREHENAQIVATTAAVGKKIVWNTGSASGYVVTTNVGQSNSGLQCREFQQLITVGGKSEQAYGQACLQTDGSWKIVQ